MTEIRVKPLGLKLYRIGPIYCTEVRGEKIIEYEVDDVADWQKRRAEAIRKDFTLDMLTNG